MPDELRAFFREQGRIGGKLGGHLGGQARGERKRRGPAHYQVTVRARLRARRGLVLRHHQLLQIALDIGSFLERLAPLVDENLEAERLKLCDRLFAAVATDVKRKKRGQR
jgi:hypothetical protein